MELRLGRRADYAIRAVLDLARHADGGRRKARSIAEAMDVPLSFLPQILADLARAGIVSSQTGPDGGYALAEDPDRTTVLAVIETVDGELTAAECVLRGGPCRWDDVCAVHLAWARAQEALRGELARTTFAELATIDAAIEAGTFSTDRRGERRRT